MSAAPDLDPVLVARAAALFGARGLSVRTFNAIRDPALCTPAGRRAALFAAQQQLARDPRPHQLAQQAKRWRLQHGDAEARSKLEQERRQLDAEMLDMRVLIQQRFGEVDEC